MPHVAARTASRDRDTGRYQSHRPEQTLLYQIVDEYYPAFAALMAEQGKELPGYVQREFEEFLQCGRLEHGFLRVRRDRLVMLRVGGGLELPPRLACQPFLFHQSGNPMATDGFIVSRQLLLNTPRSIGCPAFFVVFTDLRLQRFILLFSRAGRPGPPLIIATTRHFKHAAHQGSAELTLIGVDEGIP